MRPVWVGKRQASRTASMIKAEIRLGDDTPVGPCTLLDISFSGAKVRLDAVFELPQMFKIYISARKESRICKLRWHRDQEIGIEFLSPEQVTTFESLITLELRIKCIETALKTGGVAVAEPLVPVAFDTEAAANEGALLDDPRASTELVQRISQLETEMSRTIELVQAQINDSLSENLPQRLAKLERQSAEIHDMLKSLIPLLMNRAS